MTTPKPQGGTGRPRDRLGRPLLPGDPAAAPGVPERDRIDAGEALATAAAYLAAGLPFHAHEVLEQRWRCAPEHERSAWRALAQWAAGLTHAARGNARGATALLLRAADGLDPCADDPVAVGLALPDGRVLDVERLCADARTGAADPTRLADEVVTGGVDLPLHR